MRRLAYLVAPGFLTLVQPLVPIQTTAAAILFALVPAGAAGASAFYSAVP